MAYNPSIPKKKILKKNLSRVNIMQGINIMMQKSDTKNELNIAGWSHYFVRFLPTSLNQWRKKKICDMNVRANNVARLVYYLKIVRINEYYTTLLDYYHYLTK